MSTRAAALETVLRSPAIWRGREIAPVKARRTGHAELNRLLPGHGWPVSALIELIPMQEAIGELQLLLPALRALCQEGRDIAFIRPPHLPYPPALAKAGLPLNRVVWIDAQDDDDARWAAEQTLREGTAGAVLLWSETRQDTALRRLQLAAREAETLAFLYRPSNAAALTSPATVRLLLQHSPNGLQIEVLKAQGGRTGTTHVELTEAA